jgi:hypothetical protein
MTCGSPYTVQSFGGPTGGGGAGLVVVMIGGGVVGLDEKRNRSGSRSSGKKQRQ